MAGTEVDEGTLSEWLRLPERIEALAHGLSDAELDRPCPDSGLTVREVVHHLVEANLVASNILIAALATNGGTFDWSWVQPGGDWAKRMGYGKLPIGPALDFAAPVSKPRLAPSWAA